MKKWTTAIIATTLTASMAVSATAKIGDLGYFGGISEGTALPKTIESILTTTGKSTANNARTMEYKEVIFITGKPLEFVGNMTVSTSGTTDKDSGTYKETYNIVPSNYTDEGVQLRRRIVFDVSYQKVASVDTNTGYQIVKDSKISAWTETVTIGDKVYTLDKNKSYFSKTSNEDKSGGVTYIKSNISSRSVYTTETAGETVAQTNVGESYGYDQAWSSTETSRINTTIEYKSGTTTWQLQAQLRPSVTVNKLLQYSPNEPSITSFNGNYYEVLQRQNGLQYDITMLPQQFRRDTATTGSVTLDTYNDIEALRVPSALNLIALKGNSAEEDIKQLYSMGVFDNPQYFNPSQGMTRAQFVTALVKAIKLPIETTKATTSKRVTKTQTVEYLFQDLSSGRTEYPYIKAAYNAGLVVGKQNGKFRPDDILQVEEAYCIMLRALGTQNMAYATTPITPFVDNGAISVWARNEINYMARLGIVSADDSGKINPKKQLSKGDAAALINHLVKYMRSKMQVDYIENIVYYTK